MSTTAGDGTRPVAVVTGGGGGIGRAVAEELGRTGYVVVTVDPLVAVDGAAQDPTPEATTADRIVAAGGTARASAVSVTDRDGVRQLFADLVDEFGRLDAVVNVAGITRPSGFARGSEEDWTSVLSVHLDGYLNILGAALPIMAAAGRGRILGVTSGSGWRQADAGAYACAKRAVASLTWQLGDQMPAGVVLNAMSPIAMTRMVTTALARARDSSSVASSPPAASPAAAPSPAAPSSSAASGGLALAAMPAPEEIGPIGAHLAGEGFSWCHGQVIFAGGSEVAVIDRPRLLEVVRTDEVAALPHVLDTWGAGALVPAESTQTTTGGSNPRFGGLFDSDGNGSGDGDHLAHRPSPPNCAVVSDRPDLVAALSAALERRGATCRVVPPVTGATTFATAAAAVAATVERGGPIDALVVALDGGSPPSGGATGWEQVLAEHAGIAAGIHTDAAWARALADHVAGTGHLARLLTLTDARTTGGRSRAQASAQLARVARTATKGGVDAFAVSVEAEAPGSLPATAELAAHLLCGHETAALSGAELVAGDGWAGLRHHPRPTGSVTYGGPSVPGWLDDALRDIIGGPSVGREPS